MGIDLAANSREHLFAEIQVLQQLHHKVSNTKRPALTHYPAAHSALSLLTCSAYLVVMCCAQNIMSFEAYW